MHLSAELVENAQLLQLCGRPGYPYAEEGAAVAGSGGGQSPVGMQHKRRLGSNWGATSLLLTRPSSLSLTQPPAQRRVQPSPACCSAAVSVWKMRSSRAVSLIVPITGARCPWLSLERLSVDVKTPLCGQEPPLGRLQGRWHWLRSEGGAQRVTGRASRKKAATRPARSSTAAM